MDLTHTATVAKRVIIISIVLFILAIASYIGYRTYKAYKIAHTPPPEEQANFQYGNLADPDFPKTLAPSDSFNYTLDTKTGGLPQVGNTMRVYFMPKPFATLLAGEKSADLATKFEITTQAQILTETRYLYSQDSKNMTIEIDSSNFTYSQQDLTAADTGQVDEDDRLTEGFTNILSNGGLYRDALKEGRNKIQLLKLDPSGSYSPVSSRSEANAAQISIWPADLDKRPIETPEFNKSLINAVVQTSTEKLKDYKELNYTFWNIDTSSFAVYPLKKPEQAFNDLKSGQGVVVVKPTSNDVPISSIYLAYYEGSTYNPYLQPIYVFEAPGFAAYVSAVGTEAPSPTP